MSQDSETLVVLLQLGSPKSPAVSDVRAYLKEFLGDPRVVDINPVLWKVILNLFVLPFRPKSSAEKYARIWDGKEFLLTKNTREFAAKVRQNLSSSNIELKEAYLLADPRLDAILGQWDRQNPLERPRKVLVLPQFPQYSESTVGSAVDMLCMALKKRPVVAAFEWVTDYHKAHCFIDNSVLKIQKYWQDNPTCEHLILSFHGIPKRRIIEKKDPYYRHCYETYLLIIKHLDLESMPPIHLTFQSRFGSEEWLDPYTDQYVEGLAKRGAKKIGVYCPSFVADCLETTDEIGYELQELVKAHGTKIDLIECLNSGDKWAQDYALYIEDLLCDPANIAHKRQYSIDPAVLEKKMPKVETQSEPLDPQAKKVIKIVFLTLFLDLIGFSIIFPLFPALASYYVEVDGDNRFLRAIFDMATSLTAMGGANTSSFTPIVLFGGLLGALYSFLQFIAAPFWGGLSDKIGRRPVLLLSMIGLALSYLLWVVSGNFTILLIARFIGGVMAGNISTATAVMADVTSAKNRSKGMAFIGIAFAFGFIFGPAMGGLLSMVRLDEMWPNLAQWGVNPFSAPALLAFILSAWNIYYIARYFKETLPPEKRGKKLSDRSANPFTLFKPFPFKGVNLANYGHFLFLAAFSGMEFTLTFLAVERLSYSSMNNATMFIFIGLIIALVQGGFVRRKASQIGEKKVALYGLCFLVPGLLLIGKTYSSTTLYAGLFFLAVGSAMAIPCLTSLVSLYTPSEHQGKAVGVFRSLGALARVIGPILASLAYWRFGASVPYYLGAAFLVVPIIMVARLPAVNRPSTAQSGH